MVAASPPAGPASHGAWLRFSFEREDVATSVAMRFLDGRTQVSEVRWGASSAKSKVGSPVNIPAAEVDLWCSTYGCTALGAQGELRSVSVGRAATPIENRRPGAVALGSFGMGSCELVAAAVQCHSTDTDLATQYNALGPVAAFVSSTACVMMADHRVLCPDGRGGVAELWHAALQVSLLQRYGGYDGCAVLPDHTVECINAQAMLLGALADHARPPPTRVPGLDDVDEVQVSRSHACARRRGEVYCWGDGRAPNTWSKVARLPDVHDAVAIGVTGAATCVVHATNMLSCRIGAEAPIVVTAAPRVAAPAQPCWSGGAIASVADPALRLPPLASLERYPLKFKLLSDADKQARAAMLGQRVPGLTFGIGEVGEVSSVATTQPPCSLLARTDRDGPGGDAKGDDVEQWRAALAAALPDVPGLATDAYAATISTSRDNTQVLRLGLRKVTSVVYAHDVPAQVTALMPPRAHDDKLLQRWRQGQVTAMRVARTSRTVTPPHQCERPNPGGQPCDPYAREVVTVNRQRVATRPLGPYLVGAPRFEFAVERRGGFLYVRQVARIRIDDLRFDRDVVGGKQDWHADEIVVTPELLDAVTLAPFAFPK